MTIRALPRDARPVCAAPEWLPVVDRAFETGGAKATKLLRDRACPSCPIRVECLVFGGEGGEFGPWGGVVSGVRTHMGYPSPRTYVNMLTVKHPSLGHAAARGRTPDKVIRVWANENGYNVPVRGRVPDAVRAAYDFEHEDAAA